MDLDFKIFNFINNRWTHPLLDLFFVNLTDFTKTPVFYALVLVLALVIFQRYRWRGLAVLFFAFIAASVADVVSAEILKPLFARTRPEFSHLPFEVILRRPSEGSYSFPSSHAVDAFAAAAFVFSFSKAWGRWLLGLAGLIAYSRVYCGLHFPLDVAGGALLGSIIGILLAGLMKRGARHGA